MNLRTIFTVLALCCISIATFGQQSSHRTSQMDEPLRQFLQKYVGGEDQGKETRVAFAHVHLSDDVQTQVVVYLLSNEWCGSGGCTTLILARRDASFEIIARTTVTRPPIRVLNTTTNGFHDLGVFVAGGGIQAHEARLRFNGKKYPSNPSLQPATPSGTKGRTLIPDSTDYIPLF